MFRGHEVLVTLTEGNFQKARLLRSDVLYNHNITAYDFEEELTVGPKSTTYCEVKINKRKMLVDTALVSKLPKRATIIERLLHRQRPLAPRGN
ncbi:hypothetical protein BH11PAT1_BH11PAT1_1980 [soil metagenome]